MTIDENTNRPQILRRIRFFLPGQISGTIGMTSAYRASWVFRQKPTPSHRPPNSWGFEVETLLPPKEAQLALRATGAPLFHCKVLWERPARDCESEGPDRGCHRHLEMGGPLGSTESIVKGHAMTDEIRAPLSPAELPQQRITKVVDRPARPEGFEPVVYYGLAVEEIAPKRRPAEMRFLGGAEWAWSPMHNRIEAYYLYRSRSHWLLYLRDLDPDNRDFEWRVGAYVQKRGVDEKTAAVHLMVALWAFETNDGLEQFHWLTHDGLISVAEWRAIAREVWG
jgi:hypothetical protein